MGMSFNVLPASFISFHAGVEARDREKGFFGGHERSRLEPWPVVLFLFVQRAFAFYPTFTVLVGVSEGAAPITQIGEAFVLKGDPMDFVVVQGDESTTT